MATTINIRKKLEALRSRMPSENRPINKTVKVTWEKIKPGKKDKVTKSGHKTPHELWMKAVDDTFADGSPLNTYMAPFRESLRKVKFEKDGTMVDNEAGYYARHSFPSIHRVYKSALLSQRFQEEGTSDIKKIKKKKRK